MQIEDLEIPINHSGLPQNVGLFEDLRQTAFHHSSRIIRETHFVKATKSATSMIESFRGVKYPDFDERAT